MHLLMMKCLIVIIDPLMDINLNALNLRLIKLAYIPALILIRDVWNINVKVVDPISHFTV